MGQYMEVSVCLCVRVQIRKAHTTRCGIVIITDSFDVPDLKKALNMAVHQTANLSKVVKRRRGRRKKGTSNEEGNGEKGGGGGRRSGGRGRSVRKPDSLRDGGKEGQKLENE